MKNIFLFVYPDKRYFEHLPDLVHFNISRQVISRLIDQYDQMVEARYRSRGFEIYWLLFSDENQPNIPDLDRLSDRITVQEKDQVIPAGISYSDINKSVYADPDFIRKQLPEEIDKLVVGGFHSGDCVSKICAGMYAELRENLMVDFDLTEFLMLWSSCGMNVPIIRTNYNVLDFTGTVLAGDMDLIRKRWKDEPWLYQRRFIPLNKKEISLSLAIFLFRIPKLLVYWLIFYPIDSLLWKKLDKINKKIDRIKENVQKRRKGNFAWNGRGNQFLYISRTDDKPNRYGEIMRIGKKYHAVDFSHTPHDFFPDENELPQKEFRFLFLAKKWLKKKVVENLA